MQRLILLFLAAIGGEVVGADSVLTVDPRELPRFPPVEAQRAIETFIVKRGFHLELVAAEPLVASPVAVSFDENGRLFVLEMRDYSEQRELTPHLGRVRLLEDTDGDGRYDRATVFADDLPWPTAIIWARGGLFVCAAPDIVWLQDTNGDGNADVRRIVFTGFNSGLPKLNVQALPNSFAWGPDNLIHLQTGGGNRGVIRCLERTDLSAQELAGRDFWFDPRTFAFGFEAGGGQFGMSYDDRGRRFVCNNSDHLRTYLFDDRYGARNPFSALPSPLVSVAADGPAAEVFRISPDEPWRVVRTRWRVAGKVSGPVEGGGRVSGYFTGATGTMVYRGDAFGPDFLGNTFTGDAGGNLVHRKQLRAVGVSVVGERPADERAAEFVASRDTWFRPVSFANAPDGTLYIVDMYREVIEHPWSIPEPIKAHLDLTSGRDRGRIWRIAPDGFKARPLPALGSASNEELLAALAHPNGWHRDTATRLLCEHRDPAVVSALARLLAESASALSRLHALRVLDGLDALSEPVLLGALSDSDEMVREQAVKLTERLRSNGHAPEEIWRKLSALVQDPAPRVRLQLAFTLGEFRNDASLRTLAALAKTDVGDDWISAAARSGPPDRMAALCAELAADQKFAASSRGEEFLANLATGIGARHVAPEIDAVFAFAADSTPNVRVLGALGDGLERAGDRLSASNRESRLDAAFSRARSVVAATDANQTLRAAAARLLGFDGRGTRDSRDALLAALSQPPAPEVIRAVFDALDRVADQPTETALLRRWKELDPTLRAEVARFFTARPARARALLEAIGAGLIDAHDIPTAEIVRLRQHRDPQIATTAAKAFAIPTVESRDAVLTRLEAALQINGDVQRGHALYTERCASCHRFRGEGHVFGPDLESVVNGGKEKLLTHVIDPNREVAPQFAAYTAELNDGTVLSGVVASESPQTVVIREPLGRETTIPRSRVSRLQTTGRSPMPEGLEAGLTLSDVASLVQYLTSGAPTSVSKGPK